MVYIISYFYIPYMEIVILSIGVLISAVFAIIYGHWDNVKWFSFFKPLSTILIIAIASIIYFKFNSFYSAIIIVSLIFSLIGDVFLIHKKYFLHGLSSFLLAHIGFTIGFASIYGFNWTFTPLFFLILIGASYFIYLRKDLDKFAIPVAIYITVMVIMNWQAISLVYINNAIVFFGIAIASLLFSFSDSVLAYSKFKKHFFSEEILTLSTYWISIYIIAIAGLYLE